LSDQRRTIALVNLDIADVPSTWSDIGFSVFSERVSVGSTTLRLAMPGSGIVGWGLSGTDQASIIAAREGIPTETVQLTEPTPGSAPERASTHPNGAIQVDHVVLETHNLARTQHSLVAAGLTLRRTRAASSARVQCFYRLGETILEVVGDPSETKDVAASLWGLICTADLTAAAEVAAGRLDRPRPAVQPGRQIAIVNRSAGLSVRCGFISPPPPRSAKTENAVVS
jgi:hypothetical protein